ncbi:response regulator [Flavobacterium sp. GA093]|uniref:Response regulator n=1 Tax=Flavobacterium hydrocarbonoxydans TaxID=2683249 RepID=A0A6I4NQW0_9FLAO|nr:response regulator transcription factor [Flavobacterium hydrocarbonoxydans]MWB96786.1 response regulator [Flavobacterium hydrocarbonoxydans]
MNPQGDFYKVFNDLKIKYLYVFLLVIMNVSKKNKMKSSNIYSFLVADDHSVVRQGTSLMIKELFFSARVLQAGTFSDIFNILKENKIDILVLDINFPEGNSLNIMDEIKKIQPAIKILMFSAYDEKIYALRYLNAGASGYLSKGSTMEEMKQAFNSMILAGKYVSQIIKDKILDSYISNKPVNPLDQLSKREIEVAKLLIKGYGNLEISEMLDLKKNTVSTFKNRLFEKLEIDNIASLIDFFQLYGENK